MIAYSKVFFPNVSAAIKTRHINVVRHHLIVVPRLLLAAHVIFKGEQIR